MGFFSNSPAYKIAPSVTAGSLQSVQSTGFASRLGSLFGSTPVYQTVDGQDASQVSSGFWSMFGSSPSYKAASAATTADDDVDDDVAPGVCTPDGNVVGVE